MKHVYMAVDDARATPRFEAENVPISANHGRGAATFGGRGQPDGPVRAAAVGCRVAARATVWRTLF